MPPTTRDPVEIFLREFANTVHHNTELGKSIAAHPEDQLKGPVIALMEDFDPENSGQRLGLEALEVTLREMLRKELFQL